MRLLVNVRWESVLLIGNSWIIFVCRLPVEVEYNLMAAYIPYSWELCPWFPFAIQIAQSLSIGMCAASCDVSGRIEQHESKIRYEAIGMNELTFMEFSPKKQNVGETFFFFFANDLHKWHTQRPNKFIFFCFSVWILFILWHYAYTIRRFARLISFCESYDLHFLISCSRSIVLRILSGRHV